MPPKIACVDDSIHLATCRCEVGAIIASCVSTECPNVDTIFFFHFQLWWSFTNLTAPFSSEKLLIFGLEFGSRTDVFCVQKMSCCHFSLVWVGKFANSFPNMKMCFLVRKDHGGMFENYISPKTSVKSLNSQEAWLDFKLGGGFKYYYLSPTWGNDPLWLIFFRSGWNHRLVKEFPQGRLNMVIRNLAKNVCFVSRVCQKLLWDIWLVSLKPTTHSTWKKAAETHPQRQGKYESSSNNPFPLAS